MSWQPNGRYYRFSPEVIRACVPPSSGVYGLFNFGYQLFIGESDNLRDALLRHHGEGERSSRRYRPSRFTFQLCPADERKRKAAELIEKFQPVRQSESALAPAAPSSVEPAPSDSPLGELDHARIDLEEFSMHERESAPTAQARYYFERVQGLTLLALFAVCMTVSFYLGILAGESSQRLAHSRSEKALAWTPAPIAPAEQVAVDPAEPNGAATGPKENLSIDIPGWRAPNMEPTISTAPPGKDAPAPSGASGGASVQQAGTAVAGKIPLIAAAGNGDTNRKWSVQIAAAPTQEVADALAEGLNSAGFDGYVVQAQVKGQTFYRVRVGPLDAQDKAESVRQTLARQERYRDAFLVND